MFQGAAQGEEGSGGIAAGSHKTDTCLTVTPDPCSVLGATPRQEPGILRANRSRSVRGSFVPFSVWPQIYPFATTDFHGPFNFMERLK
jgi:hypothetical protein